MNDGTVFYVLRKKYDLFVCSSAGFLMFEIIVHSYSYGERETHNLTFYSMVIYCTVHPRIGLC